MTVATMTNTTWTYTCKICKTIRTALGIAFVGLIAFSESAGRARAASELSRQGYYDEARALMLSPREYGKDV
tara:strand:- start:773 stop:988 length:216 start_codon:yes stop_codon:yes gene_type:complete